MVFRINRPETKERRRELRRNQTDAESKFWNLIRGRKLNRLKFYRQYNNGPYILDFYCPDLKLAVELDGGQHNTIEGRTYDEERTHFLEAQNIIVVRFWNNEVLENPEGVWEKLQETINHIHK